MQEKVYTITQLDCANCAAKMETGINKLPGVQAATITFATRQLRVTAEDPDALLEAMQKVVSRIESDARICEKDSHEHHHKACSCGHDHDHEHEHDHDHDHEHEHEHDHEHDHEHKHKHEHDHGDHQESIVPLLIGAGLFLIGLLLDHLGISLLGIAVSLPVYIAAYLLLGWNVLFTAGKNLFKGHVFDENFLMSIATLGAFVIREFPEAVGVMLFYRVGEYFEHRAVERSRNQIMQAVDLRPETVNRMHGDQIEVIPAEQAQVGDLLLVRPGDRIPLDGTVVTGSSRIDTAPITGEPVPVQVDPGSAVTSGCVNTSGQLTIRVEKPLSESMVTRILNAVEKAAAGKPKLDRFITRFARIYTPVVVGVAAATAVIPSLITGDWNYWVYTALSFLVMSCPCALVLSVPLAFFSGIGVGSRKGILFKGGASMEAAAGIKAVALDKTGTITRGDFRVQSWEGREDLLVLAAACEQHSTHPIAVSITAAAQGLSLPQPQALEEIPGHGIIATLYGKQILCGNEKLMTSRDICIPAVTADAGTLVYVAEDGTYLGYLLIADTLKEGAAEAVAQLHRMGISTVMLTGDRKQTADAVAQQTGLQQVYAQLLPEEKLEVLQTIRAEKGAVMFVGDGINDAPVLTGADVGAAMGSGADAAIEAADVVFMTSDVHAVTDSLQIARRTRTIAWQNVIFALVIKAVVMVLGLCGLASMWLAVFADSGVAMLCVLNSIRQLYSGRKK